MGVVLKCPSNTMVFEMSHNVLQGPVNSTTLISSRSVLAQKDPCSMLHFSAKAKIAERIDSQNSRAAMMIWYSKGYLSRYHALSGGYESVP